MNILALIQSYAQNNFGEFLIVFCCLVLLCVFLSFLCLAWESRHTKQNNRQIFKENIGGNKTDLRNNAGRRA